MEVFVFWRDVLTVTEETKRKLTAVFSTDVVGNSRLMGEDEVATVKSLKDYKSVMFP